VPGGASARNLRCRDDRERAGDQRQIWYPSTGYHGDGGVLDGAHPIGPLADGFTRVRHDARVRDALAAGVEIDGAVTSVHTAMLNQ
jgi:hypothetical protein